MEILKIFKVYFVEELRFFENLVEEKNNIVDNYQRCKRGGGEWWIIFLASNVVMFCSI